MTRPRIADHAVSVGVSLGGIDWDATAHYDVLSEPAPATLTDPPQGLELDVVRIVLDSWCGEGGPIAIPAGVHVEPDSIAPEALEYVAQACIDDWHECHSRAARDAERADRERERHE